MRIPYELIAPKTINAVNAADGVYVNWSKVPDAEKNEVYRKTSSDDDYRMIGTATKKNYTDKTVKEPYYYRYKVKAVKGSIRSEYSDIAATYRLDANQITSLTNGSAGWLTVKYTTMKYSTGYEIQIAEDVNFTSGVKKMKVANPNTNNRTFKGLRKGRTYYARVRVYRVKDGVTYYSQWCSRKALKLTK